MDKDDYIQNCQCIHCKKHIFKTCQPTNSEGNIYSIDGLKEYLQSGLCEYCFDKMTKETEEEMNSEDFDDYSYREPKIPPNFRELNCCGNCERVSFGDEWCYEFNCEVYINTVCDDYVKKHYPKTKEEDK